ncbi:MAG TPA: bifunctional (p)ppGpp synthetase/guanosine-3',5'-bis(diphosphate) 3'-pyrophosphohydrolase [Clostridiaceae bacterium]|nr:bifunctional (p)ppGpp synthetase/guanosine-3',5'-bis(diphosphate) 3'-pyrophosphohydrolase [Clostridiaceae bacterium]
MQDSLVVQKDYEKLLKAINEYNPGCKSELLEKAYLVSRRAHDGQMRVSGEPYITHPVEVACILAELGMDCATIVAGLLHDTIEDTTFTFEQLSEIFGEEIASLVDGVTKLGKIPYSTKEEQQAENLRKMFMAMAKDIRVIMIKLADRLHNMRTLKYLSTDRQQAKAKETLEIYAPLAHRLGISKIKWELEDLCLRYLDPKGYYELVNSIAQKRKEREAYITQITESLKTKIDNIGIKAHIEGRPKHFYSIYKKMKNQNRTLDQIYDLFAVRIIVDTVKDCYAVLGLVHEHYRPFPGRFKDYIAVPKPNMYQSLHTTVIGHEGVPFEVQIRTWEMHRVAEVGIAAHWKYKEGNTNTSDFEIKLTWLRQLLEWQKEMRDAKEFVETLKVDLFSGEVFVFTPKGDVINLPAGSTPIDFAYAIHSAIGNKMMGAKVNGKLVPLEYKLQNGDMVEILTSASIHGPSRDWLKIVKSTQARNKINAWFKKEKREENIARGKELVEKELKKEGLPYSKLFKPEWVDIILKKYSFNTLDDLYAAIGYGAITSHRVVSRLKEEYRKTLKPEELVDQELERAVQTRSVRSKKSPRENGIVVKGLHNCLVRLSRCCNPVPGDDIIGYITRGRGVSVHRRDCVNVLNNINEQDRLIEVSWYTAGDVAYNAEINVLAYDRPALLMDITNVLGDSKIPLKAMNARTTKDNIAIMNLTLEITDTEQLEKIIKSIRKVHGVFEVERSKHQVR